MQKRKILIIRFSSIGDIVLTTPVIRALHQQLGAEVHLLTKQSFKNVLIGNPHIQKVWSIQKHVAEVRQALREEGFTEVVDLHNNLRSRQVAWALWGIPVYRFNKLNWKKWLLTRFKVNKLPNVHIVDRYMAAAAPLGVHIDGEGLDYFIPDEAHVNPAAFGISSPYIALVTGAAHATKRLPEAQLVAICKNIPIPVVLLGGPDEAEQGARIAEQAGALVRNGCGQFSLAQSASLAAQSAAVITHDTGLMHIAAALRKPIVSVWGNTVPQFGMYAYNTDETRMEVSGLPCRPCSKIGSATCPKGHFNCMQKQDAAAIATAAMAKI